MTYTVPGLVAVLGWCVDDFESALVEVSDEDLIELRTFLLKPEEGEDERTRRLSLGGVRMIERERLGRLVRQEWVAWAREQPNAKLSWLTPWKKLASPEREVDRRIGYACARQEIVEEQRGKMTEEKETYTCSKCKGKQNLLDAFMFRESGLCFTCYNAGPGKNRPAIREENDLDDAWFAKAKKVESPEQLVAFMQQVMNGYVHDYGTVCKAIAACALAATYCADRMEGAREGITGFQAGAVFWEYGRRWLSLEGPVKLVQYERMLYPQHEKDFRPALSSNTVEWLREKASELLKKNSEDEDAVHPNVRQHWEQIVAGEIPFGYEADD